MKLWRLTRAPFVALDGKGAEARGGRYSPPGVPVVAMASEAGLAVLVALRYLPADREHWPSDHVLGWTEVDATLRRIDDDGGDHAIRQRVSAWLDEGHELLAAVRSKVLPEADVVLFNPRHRLAPLVPPLVTRPFSFDDCLHVPPMLQAFRE
jgi:hypothetical protein